MKKNFCSQCKKEIKTRVITSCLCGHKYCKKCSDIKFGKGTETEQEFINMLENI